jgi:hypothetical protein
VAETAEEKAAREAARNDVKTLFKEAMSEFLADQQKTRTEAEAAEAAARKDKGFGGGLLSRLGLE